MAISTLVLILFNFLPRLLPAWLAAISWLALFVQIVVFLGYRWRRRSAQYALNRNSAVQPGEQFFLYLRPFLTAGRITAPNPTSWIHRAFMGTKIDFELVASLSLHPARLIAVGDRARSLGAAKILDAGDDWFTLVRRLGQDAAGIIAVPLDRTQTMREMRELSASPMLLQKTLLVMPPRSGPLAFVSGGYAGSWRRARQELSDTPMRLPPYDGKGAFLVLDDRGEWTTLPIKSFAPEYVAALLKAAAAPLNTRGRRDLVDIARAMKKPRRFWLQPESAFVTLQALLVAITLRWFIVQPVRVPQGSMEPTLLVGDYMVMTKWSYGYSKFSLSPLNFGPPGRIFSSRPERGDVVVFRPSGIEDKDFVKRLIGLPGDKIQVIDSVLHINGEPVKREHIGTRQFTNQYGYVDPVEQYLETLPNGVSYTTFDYGDGPGDHTQTYEVPQGHYLMMGDNRDNSADSRNEMGGFGFVPHDHLVGKAQFVFVSFDETTSVLRPWTLATGIRRDRVLKSLN